MTKVKLKSKTRIATYTLQRVKESSGLYDIGKIIRQPADVQAIANEVLQMDTLPAEHFVVLSLDTKNKVTALNVCYKGTLNSSVVHPREVFQAALLNNSRAIIVLHNHPSGDPTPSQEDIDVSRRLKEAGRILGIDVLDHVVYGSPTKFVSMKEKGLF